METGKKPENHPFNPEYLKEDTVYLSITGKGFFKLERMKDGFAYYFKLMPGGAGEEKKLTINEFCQFITAEKRCVCGKTANEALKVEGDMEPMCRDHATKHWISRRM